MIALYSALLATPLLLFILQPEALARSKEVSVFHGTSLLEGVSHVILNIALVVNPVFLFMFGDPNLRHATGIQGMLGVAALLPLLALAWYAVKKYKTQQQKTPNQEEKRQKLLIIIALAGIATSILGSALTNEGQPHSLRGSAAWLFIVMLLPVGWAILWRSRRRWLKITAIIVFAVSTLAYVVDLAFFYPARAAESFDAAARTQIQQGQSPESYPELSLEYYRSR